jgi:hypothetical protein
MEMPLGKLGKAHERVEPKPGDLPNYVSHTERWKSL